LLAQLFQDANTLYEQIQATSKEISDTEVDEAKEEADLKATLDSVNALDERLRTERD
jgi:hypothetical protein